ncbi:intradiol ring-cleavage dioxygenase [Aureibaculum algae]|uniref:Intradiol ring-cleavage dioxygenase n=1 Tax=Aureibaculum algae TaxID=2584122 RepID=A0A5B7TST1_9FLAO|nr:intradiol ring-cleavage dioxygenase [Aureibaculum algae]QCX39410.1 intradiol ring-cleavage dioxygenase [Aureibaculum algae]
MDVQTPPLRYPINVLRFIFLLTFIGILTNCNGQTKTNTQQTNVKTEKKKLVDGGCDGCELMYIGMPQNMKSVDTSSGWSEKGQKLLITGTVYRLGGKIPAPNVIIYYWQTDTDGYYSPREGMDEQAKKNGHIRGWVKTDENGNYSIYTIRPVAYPNRDIPAHIHISIKEPNIKDEYYIDGLVFDDDILLTGNERKKLENRGGSGVLRVLIDKNIQIAEHNIILGLNIPNYPEKNQAKLNSGLEIGEDNPSFTPFHAYGPDKGTRTCPVCKYGRFHGIVYFVGNHPNWKNLKKWLSFLELESINRSKYLKVYFVYGNENDYNKDKRQKDLAKLGSQLNIKNMALTFVPSFSDEESEVNLNKINPDVENTFIMYRQRTIIDKFVNLKPTRKNYKLISQTLDKTKSEFFNIQEPKHH